MEAWADETGRRARVASGGTVGAPRVVRRLGLSRCSALGGVTPRKRVHADTWAPAFGGRPPHSDQSSHTALPAV